MFEKFKVQDVLLTDLTASEVKIREAKKDHEKYAETTISIRKFGVMQPILVRPLKDEKGVVISGKYEICDGWQRFNISQDLGLKSIPCRVIEANDDEMVFFQMILNEHRIPQKPKEVLERLKSYMFAHPDLTHADLGELFCKTAQDVGKILSLQKLNENALELANNGQIKATAAFALASVPLDHQTDELIEDAIKLPSGEFISKVASLKKAIREARRAGNAEVGPIIVPHPLSRKELIIIWEDLKRTLGQTDVEDDNYLYVSGQHDMIEKVLQVDPETLATKEAEKEKAKAEAAEERAKKRAEMANKALLEVKEKRAKLAEAVEV